MSRWAAAAVVVVALAAGGVRGGGEPQGPMALFGRGPELTDRQLAELTDRMARTMVSLRGLPLPGPIPKRFYTPAEIRRVFLQQLDKEWPPEQMARWSEAYQALGLLPRGIDLREVLTKVMTEQMAGAYDTDTKSMLLVRGTPVVMLRPVLVHELTHAAQDARFDLDSLPLRQHRNDDLALAVGALVEGDATAVMMDFLAGRDTSTIADLEGLMASGPQWMGSPALALAPRVVQELLLFPYLSGLRLVGELRRRGGWQRVNQAYRDYPLSSEQVLHPEKYLERRDWPQRVRIPEVRGGTPAGEVIQENVLGEFGLRILLEEYLTTEEAVRASEGWDGDRFRVWRRGPGREPGPWLVVLVTTWDSAEDAREFFEAYSRLVANKYRREEALPGGDEGRRRWRSERGQVEVLLRGLDVVVVEGVGEAERGALWRALSRYDKEEIHRWPPGSPGDGSAPVERDELKSPVR